MRIASLVVATTLTAVVNVMIPSSAQAAVSSRPAPTPQLADTTASVEEVRQFARCGGVMYAVGRFAHVKNAGTSTLIPRNNAFAFSASSPYRVNAWNPNLDGEVTTVACAPDGDIILGGAFRTAGGVSSPYMAKFSPAGAKKPWGFTPRARVEHVEVIGGHAIVGGRFAGYLDSRNPYTGADDGYDVPSISGTYDDPHLAPNSTRVYNMTQSPARNALIISGVFTSVGGQHREQLARLNLGANGLVVSGWHATELDKPCGGKQPFYAQDAAWVGNRIYTATTGFRYPDNPAGEPREGPCDAVIAYPDSENNVTALWYNYTGCDSLLSVAADAETVYAGGHQRWANNRLGCDVKGPGAVEAPGLGFFNPVGGAYIDVGESRSRGIGATELLRLHGGAGAGLWIGSDNAHGSSTCGGQRGHMGICYLPE